MRRYASVYGLELGDLYRNPDVSVAAIGMLWVKARAPQSLRAYLRSVFAEYWRGALDIEAAAAIEAIMRSIGVETSGWAAYLQEPGRTAFELMSSKLRAAGVFDVPAYVIEGELFFGRQHLPMIRWLLTGKAGEPPI